MDIDSTRSSASFPPPHDSVVGRLRELATDGTTAGHPAGALFARLKALNRAANGATRQHKQATADARHEMDQTHLGLQNLLYEKRHLEREIDKCRLFASIYQDIPLYASEEFLALAPEESRSQEILADEHKLMISRLNFELAERQRLEAKRKSLTQEKEVLLKQSKTRQTIMDNVKTQIDVLVKSAAEVQKKVDDLVPAPPQEEPMAMTE